MAKQVNDNSLGQNLKIINCLPEGIVKIPPSKSISHRALICAALAGQSLVKNLGFSKDVQATLNCLKAMGAQFSEQNAKTLIEKPISNPVADTVLDCGESGSTLRFLLPLALVFGVPLSFTGQGRLLERPLGEYLSRLTEKGGHFDTEKGFIHVSGSLHAGVFKLSGQISSQFVTGLLMALPLLKEDSEIIITSELESKAYVDLTVNVMQSFGVIIENRGYKHFIIKGGQSYKPCSYEVEGDFSAAAFFLVASALGCKVSCVGLNPASLQGDRAIIDIIKNCGGQVSFNEAGEFTATAAKLKAVSVDVKDIPDLVPPLTALLCFCEGESKITGAARLRFKESDRLHALATQFNALGAKIEELEDELIITGVEYLKGGVIDPHNDHRIAMAVAVASIKSTGLVKIAEPECVAKSYPAFWQDFCRIAKA
jgi:3-phosphoshikimate 1-carboxyvinyltransferase